MVFTGLAIGAIGALAVAAYISQSADRESSADGPGLMRGDVITGTVTSGPVVTRGDSAAVAARLQAERNSWPRDDVAAARPQLDAVGTPGKIADQMIAPQDQLNAQAAVEKPARTSSSWHAKSGHSRDSRYATREHSNHAASHANNRRLAETVAVGADVVGASSGNGSAANASAVTIEPDAPVQQSTEAVQTAPSNARAEPVAQTISPALVAQPTLPSDTLPKSDSAPDTRAQVRAEIVRGREDGSLPAFGNPNPGWPGGASSRPVAPAP
ncbi:hypothetical protein [Paraburkholderia ribeironis]|nr:hypothetical protein [Paraburkholderia ribeironis]